MLSLYSPHADDAVDWARGDYAATTRGGWTDSPAGSARKKQVRMIEEGSVLMSLWRRSAARTRGGRGARRLSASRLASRVRARRAGAP